MKGLMEASCVDFGRRRRVEGGMESTRSLNFEVAPGAGISSNMTWISKRPHRTGPDTLI